MTEEEPVIDMGYMSLPAEIHRIAEHNHEMRYRAGFSIGGVHNDPYWYCVCGAWRMSAKPMPNRKAGNNKIEAERSFDGHNPPEPMEPPC